MDFTQSVSQKLSHVDNLRSNEHVNTLQCQLSLVTLSAISVKICDYYSCHDGCQNGREKTCMAERATISCESSENWIYRATDRSRDAQVARYPAKTHIDPTNTCREARSGHRRRGVTVHTCARLRFTSFPMHRSAPAR